jgi:hypothetical protein
MITWYTVLEHTRPVTLSVLDKLDRIESLNPTYLEQTELPVEYDHRGTSYSMNRRAYTTGNSACSRLIG